MVEDVAECKTVVEDKCHENSVGYTASQDCSKWHRKVCSIKKQSVRKNTLDTACKKIAVKMCVPTGCGYLKSAERMLRLISLTNQKRFVNLTRE